MLEQKKKKIIYFITKSNFGGAQRYVYDLATSISKDKFEVMVACGGNGALTDILSLASIPSLIIPNLIRNVNILDDILVFSHILGILRREQPDIIHLNSSKIGGLGALAGRLAGVKNIIFTSHGWAWHESRSQIGRFSIKFLHWITVLLCHTTITVAEKERIEMSALPWTKNKLAMVHNGIRPIDFLEKSISRNYLISKNPALAIYKDSLWIGAIGELHRNKGYEYLIPAYANLEISPTAPLVIVGEGEERLPLENLARTVLARKETNKDYSEKIIFLGNIPDASKYLKAFDIFTLTSIKEGLPYVLLEAGLAGLPIVASEIGGIPEIISNNVSGILTRPRDIAGITASLSTLLCKADLRENLGGSIKASIAENFTLDQMIRQTSVLYNE